MGNINKLRRLVLAGDVGAMLAVISSLEQAEKECDVLRADRATLQRMVYSLKDHLELVEQEKATLMGILRRTGNAIEALDDTSVENARLIDDYQSALSICSGERGIPVGAIDTLLAQAMEIAVKNGANSVSMPDEYVEIAAWLCGVPARATITKA